MANEQLGELLYGAFAAARQGRSGGRRQQQERGGDEDVEIFNIESGWKIDSLEGLEDLLDAAGEGWSVEAAPEPASGSGRSTAAGSGASLLDDGWSVEAVGSGPSDDLDEFVDEGDFELGSGDADWEAAASSGRGQRGAAEAQPVVTFGGRVVAGKAEQQVLASLPRHMLRRLEEEQREADEGGMLGGWAARLVGLGIEWQVVWTHGIGWHALARTAYCS